MRSRRDLSLVVVAATLGWPAAFAGHLLHRPTGHPPTAVPCERAMTPSPQSPHHIGETSAAAPPVQPPTLLARASVGWQARAITEALDRRDWAGVAAFVSEVHGIDFLDRAEGTDSPRHLTAEELRGCGRDRRESRWIRFGPPATTCARHLENMLGSDGGRYATGRVTYDLDHDEGCFLGLRSRYPGALRVDYRRFETGPPDGCGGNDSLLTLVFVPAGDAWRLAAVVGN